MKKVKILRRLQKLPEYIHEKMLLFQDLPGIFTDRVLKMSILSFIILLFGMFMGIQMESIGFAFWSVLISAIVFVQALLLLHTAFSGNYEVVEGTVLEISGKNPLWKLRKIKVGFPDGGETVLLLEKSIPVEKGVRYRFYFNCRQDALSGIRTVDATLNTGSFYGFEKSGEG